ARSSGSTATWRAARAGRGPAAGWRPRDVGGRRGTPRARRARTRTRTRAQTRPEPEPGPGPGRGHLLGSHRGGGQRRARAGGRGGVSFSAAVGVAGVGGRAWGVAALFAPASGGSEVLRWTALAVLLRGAAAHRWWFAGRAEERSRRIAAELGPADVAEAERE